MRAMQRFSQSWDKATSKLRRWTVWACGALLASGMALGPSSASAQALTVSLATNAATFAPGDSLIVSVGVDNPGIATSPRTRQVSLVDFLFGALLPDGDTVVFFTDLAFNVGVGSLLNPSTLQPIVAGVDLTTPFVLNQPVFFTFTWSGTEPLGSYVLFLAAVVPGALADNSIDAGDIVAVSTAVVNFVAPPIPDIRGTYPGSGILTETNCQDPLDNGTFMFTSSVTISNQTGATFSGTATLSTTVRGFAVRVDVNLSGTVTAAGSLSGSSTHQTFVEGAFDSSGDGTFTGQVTGNMLTINFSGQDTFGDTCIFMGSLSGTR